MKGMAPVIPGITIKPTGWGLFSRVALFTPVCFIMAGMASAVGGSFWLILVIMWLLGVAVALVIHRARLTTTGDVLTYRGPLGTRAWHHEEIAAFWLAKSRWTRPRGLRAHVEMETVTGEVVAFWAIEASLLSNSEELDSWLATLWDWLEADQPALD